MSEEGIKSPDGEVVMECRDCHELTSGGINMTRVTMEDDCADCHQLTFDPATPNRVVPHGSPPAPDAHVARVLCVPVRQSGYRSKRRSGAGASASGAPAGWESAPKEITDMLVGEGELETFLGSGARLYRFPCGGGGGKPVRTSDLRPVSRYFAAQGRGCALACRTRAYHE
ncbi:MAG: hypothetical protein U5O39_03655 [Gammaproteobacteria bacterium]|nr:hypothetical protein [Gammaproteobacteria bacterium]